MQATYSLTFELVAHMLAIVVYTDSCAFDTVSAGGAKQPALWDWGQLVSLAGKIMHVSPGLRSQGLRYRAWVSTLVHGRADERVREPGTLPALGMLISAARALSCRLPIRQESVLVRVAPSITRRTEPLIRCLACQHTWLNCTAPDRALLALVGRDSASLRVTAVAGMMSCLLSWPQRWLVGCRASKRDHAD